MVEFLELGEFTELEEFTELGQSGHKQTCQLVSDWGGDYSHVKIICISSEIVEKTRVPREIQFPLPIQNCLHEWNNLD